MPSLVGTNSSILITCCKRLSTSTSLNFVKRTIAHLDYIGSMSLLESLQASANLVEEENSVITILRAYYALVVSASASSSMMILCMPAGTFTFW